MARRTTIANRWFLKSFSAVVIVLVLLDIVLYCMFRSYFYSTVEQTLRSELNVISTVLTRYYNSSSTGSGTNYSNEVRNTVESFTKKDRMELMMINSEGKVVITSSGFEPSNSYDMPDYDYAVKDAGGIGTYSGYQSNGEKVMAVTSLLETGNTNYNAVRVITSLSKVDKQLGIIMIFIIAISGAIIILMLVLGLYFIQSIVMPLRQISVNARKIAKGDFGVHIEEKTDDELGELCRVFNYMADELENSEKIKNDFISSVSHELRTPLTAIKGWSETIATSPGDKEVTKKGIPECGAAIPPGRQDFHKGENMPTVQCAGLRSVPSPESGACRWQAPVLYLPFPRLAGLHAFLYADRLYRKAARRNQAGHA